MVCPKTPKKLVLWEVNRQSHTSIEKTITRVLAGSGWVADIRHLVNAFENCKAAKHRNSVQNKNRQRLQAGQSCQVVSIYTVNHLTQTPRENTGAVRLLALPILNATADTIAELLQERVFCYLGIPDRIYTNQNAQFESRLMYDWAVRPLECTEESHHLLLF